ncbi:hypothetical protein CBR_g26468 [Chara braunii]|uniref:DUF659 domain-containing protein n=1 Tax=Chara braunii TaxID=69332 RepID=A0A388L802_CHABU|nr:hypothetical protein CBR_g26468 [Chara braunii]|eukprot:GBG78439.1 hypothetical protein CBR_g26468 [Chara braunii]
MGDVCADRVRGSYVGTSRTEARVTTPTLTRRESSMPPPSAPSFAPASPVSPPEPATATADTEELASSLAQHGLLRRGGAIHQLRLRSPSLRILQEEGEVAAAAAAAAATATVEEIAAATVEGEVATAVEEKIAPAAAVEEIAAAVVEEIAAAGATATVEEEVAATVEEEGALSAAAVERGGGSPRRGDSRRGGDLEDLQDLASGDGAGASGEPDTSSAVGDGGRDTGSTGVQGGGVGYDSTSVQRRERADFVAYAAASDSRGPDLPSKIVEHMRGPVLAVARPPRPPSGAQQSSMTSYVVDELQKEFDQGVASFFFENVITFNAARSDSYKNLERILNLAARSRKILRMPGYNYLRTKALPAEYKVVDNDLDNIREVWDVTGLTLMTDGTTTTSNRPVMNFIAAGDSGAVMVKSVDMEGKDKSTPALARMWEEVIRELGVHRVNAICTDSAQVDIAARKILNEHEDPAISSIPWVPCACHVCNLLMSDMLRCHGSGRSKSTRFDVREIQEEGADDGAWLLDLSYHPHRLADDDHGKTAAAIDEEEDDRDYSDGDDELVEVQLTDKRFGRRSGGGSCSATHVDITPLADPASSGPSTVATVSLMGDTGARTRLRSCAAGGVASVHGTSTVLGAQHTPHRRPAVEEPPTGRGATNGGSADVDGDNAAAGDVRNFGVSTKVPVPGAAEREDGDIGADKDHPVPGAAEGTQCTGDDVFSTPDPGLPLADGFASLLHLVAPIVARGSKKDFGEHLVAMSPMRSDSEGQTPDWARVTGQTPDCARFTGPTPPNQLLSKDIPTEAGDGSQGIMYKRRVRAARLDHPQDAAAERESSSPPEINVSLVRQVKSLAGRKKGGKNKPKETAEPSSRGRRGKGHKTATPPGTLQEKRAVVRQTKKRKAQKV